ncbi:MAG: hypothetical protein IJD09_02965 [Clostridia bacterium]|nr:hypothetical protein [Clostridia bacterium]
MKKIKGLLALFLCIIVIVVIIAAPYIKAEYLTAAYGNEFKGLEAQTHMLNNSRYHKVLEYSDDAAKVFYVSDTGDLITFVKNADSWELSEWKTVWSKTGSASDFMWPYYR